MREELMGIGVRLNTINLVAALSGNVFSFGVEWYEGLFAIRIGPIFLSVATND